jgi:hypothetical protein
MGGKETGTVSETNLLRTFAIKKKIGSSWTKMWGQ